MRPALVFSLALLDQVTIRAQSLKNSTCGPVECVKQPARVSAAAGERLVQCVKGASQDGVSIRGEDPFDAIDACRGCGVSAQYEHQSNNKGSPYSKSCGDAGGKVVELLGPDKCAQFRSATGPQDGEADNNTYVYHCKDGGGCLMV